jgi:hypothetical protein
MMLDHVSLTAPRGLLEEAGFTVTSTPEADGAHGRVLLERGYFEVVPGDALVARGWFVRPASGGLSQWHKAARGAGLPVLTPEVYMGADGTWLDVAFGGPDAPPGLPIVTERTAPADLAAVWPPPASPHANRADRIARIDIETDHPDRLTDMLRRLAGPTAGTSGDIGFGNGTVRVRVADRAGTRIAAVIIDREPGAATAPASQATDDQLVIDGPEIRLLPKGLGGAHRITGSLPTSRSSSAGSTPTSAHASAVIDSPARWACANASAGSVPRSSCRWAAQTAAAKSVQRLPWIATAPEALRLRRSSGSSSSRAAAPSAVAATGTWPHLRPACS